MKIPPKTIPQIADEYDAPHKTFYNKLKKNAFLKENLQQGLQLILQQKWIYDRFGYPPDVNKSDYDGVE